MAYTATIKFIAATKKEALVFQTLSGSSLNDGYRLVNADFSSKAINDSITYSYNTFAGSLTDDITIV